MEFERAKKNGPPKIVTETAIAIELTVYEGIINEYACKNYGISKRTFLRYINELCASGFYGKLVLSRKGKPRYIFDIDGYYEQKEKPKPKVAETENAAVHHEKLKRLCEIIYEMTFDNDEYDGVFRDYIENTEEDFPFEFAVKTAREVLGDGVSRRTVYRYVETIKAASEQVIKNSRF